MKKVASVAPNAKATYPILRDTPSRFYINGYLYLLLIFRQVLLFLGILSGHLELSGSDSFLVKKLDFLPRYLLENSCNNLRDVRQLMNPSLIINKSSGRPTKISEEVF